MNQHMLLENLSRTKVGTAHRAQTPRRHASLPKWRFHHNHFLSICRHYIMTIDVTVQRDSRALSQSTQSTFERFYLVVLMRVHRMLGILFVCLQSSFTIVTVKIETLHCFLALFVVRFVVFVQLHDYLKWLRADITREYVRLLLLVFGMYATHVPLHILSTGECEQTQRTLHDPFAIGGAGQHVAVVRTHVRDDADFRKISITNFAQFCFVVCWCVGRFSVFGNEDIVNLFHV